MNPPWGARLNHDADHYRNIGYRLARGQFNSWDLFVEWTIKTFPNGSTVAAIVPDSFFLKQHSGTRRMLFEETQLKAVIRIGEGWFPSVFRGATLLIYQIGEDIDKSVYLLRLDNQTAKKMRSGLMEPMKVFRERAVCLDACELDLGDNYEISFPGTTSIRSTIHKIERRRGSWTSWFEIGRGVEIGANGKVQRCKNCKIYVPPMKNARPCEKCGDNRWDTEYIIESVAGEKQGNLIVGRDVKRYSATPSRHLMESATGINYKDRRIYQSPKLLIRKTGLGIVAGIDLTGAYTNQVVFNYVPNQSAEPWVIYFVEAMLCSRLILAYHIFQSGEDQWRSHPYVTPTIIARFPIIKPANRNELKQAREIGRLAKLRHSAAGSEAVVLETEIDRNIENMYGLDAADRNHIEVILSGVQNLRAFSHLQKDTLNLGAK